MTIHVPLVLTVVNVSLIVVARMVVHVIKKLVNVTVNQAGLVQYAQIVVHLVFGAPTAHNSVTAIMVLLVIMLLGSVFASLDSLANE